MWDEYWRPRPSLTPVSVVTPSVLFPIDIDDAKRHTNIRLTDTTFDEQLDEWIQAATRKVEQDTEMALLTQTLEVTLSPFPCAHEAILLPRRPVQVVPATQFVKYYDSAGVEQTWSAGNYVIDIGTNTLGLALNADWPTDVWVDRPVTVRFVAGYTSPSLIPPDLKHAVRLLVGHFSEERQAAREERVEAMAFGYESLIGPYQLHRAA